MSLSVRQLADELWKDVFYLKHFRAVCEHADGSRHGIIDVRKDEAKKEIVLVSDEVMIMEEA